MISPVKRIKQGEVVVPGGPLYIWGRWRTFWGGQVWVMTWGKGIPGTGSVMLAKGLSVQKQNSVPRRVTGEPLRQEWCRTLRCTFSFFIPLSPFLCLILFPDPREWGRSLYEWTEDVCTGTVTEFPSDSEPSFPPSSLLSSSVPPSLLPCLIPSFLPPSRHLLYT